MPYKIEKLKNGYYSVRTENGRYKSRHTTLAKAKAQVRLLYMIDTMGPRQIRSRLRRR
jgi:hypothetical protein